MSEWTPTDDEAASMFITGWCCDTDPETGKTRPDEAWSRWLAAHDKALRRTWTQEATEDVIVHDEALEKALREQIAWDLIQKLPRILADTSADEFGWLSDGLYKDAEADSMDSEVRVRDGGIDLDQIAEYAARIVGVDDE